MFFDKKIGEELPSDKAPSMPLKNLEHLEELQFSLSTFTVNSFFHSLTEVSDPQVWIRNSGITCSDLNTLLPGISERYGGSAPVDIFFHLHQIDDFQVFGKNSETRATSSFDLQFWAHAWDGELLYAAGLGLDGVKFGMELLTDDMSLTT